MIKKITLSLFCLFSIFANGQNNKFEPEWNVGVGFGPTFSAVDFVTNKNNSGIPTKSLQQFHGGFAVRYISEKNLGIIAELNYAQQGWAQEFKETPQFAHSHQLNYIELPLLTHIYFGNKVRFFVNLGPKISFLVSDSEKINDALAEYLASGETSETTITHQYYRLVDRRFDYGLMAGMGLEFRSGIGNFALEGRYAFGLGDVYNSQKSDYFGRSANRVMSVKLTYYIKLF